jgi:hypothetical protein
LQRVAGQAHMTIGRTYEVIEAFIIYKGSEDERHIKKYTHYRHLIQE